MATASSSEVKGLRTCVNVYQTPGSSSNLSRHKILDWINATLQKKYKTIEQLCDGLAYCYLMDLMFPGSVFLKKLLLEAKLEDHYVHNLKLLQLALKKVNSDKSVPLDKLCKGRFQDNLEFVQWFKMFWDANYKGEPNSTLEARSASWGYGMNKTSAYKSRCSLDSPTASLFRNKSSNALNTSRASSTDSVGSRSSFGSTPTAAPKPTRVGYRQSTSGTTGNTSVVRPMLSRNSSETALSRQRSVQAKIDELTKEKSDLEMKKADLGSKRDGYFNKLIKIELLCQEWLESDTNEKADESELVEKVRRISNEKELVNQNLNIQSRSD